MANIVNLTPHMVNVVDVEGNEILSIPTSGEVARAVELSQPAGEVNGIGVSRVEYGAVEGLPEPKEGTMYIVSALVRMAEPNRSDLLSPGKLVRNSEGQPVGCLGFVCN